MLYTNTANHGGNFLDTIDEEFRTANNVTIASGYVSLDILQRYHDPFLEVVRRGGKTRLLLGMAFFEGLSNKKLNFLTEMSEALNEREESSGVYVTWERRYHGKIYDFQHDEHRSIYVGSSNFSRSGLSGNIEATVSVTEENTISNIDEFLSVLFSGDTSTEIRNADITVPGSKNFVQKISVQTLSDLDRYDPSSIDTEALPKFSFPLSRIVEKEKSSLNVYFGKGRWSRSTGKVVPRNWYEVELIANKAISSLETYPKGNFTAYTDDGYVLPMVTNGDYFKNIRSKGNLRLLGMWIKNKLQESGALVPLTPVTQDTLDVYGEDEITFFKISDTKYFLKF